MKYIQMVHGLGRFPSGRTSAGGLIGSTIESIRGKMGIEKEWKRKKESKEVGEFRAGCACSALFRIVQEQNHLGIQTK